MGRRAASVSGNPGKTPNNHAHPMTTITPDNYKEGHKAASGPTARWQRKGKSPNAAGVTPLCHIGETPHGRSAKARPQPTPRHPPATCAPRGPCTLRREAKGRPHHRRPPAMSGHCQPTAGHTPSPIPCKRTGKPATASTLMRCEKPTATPPHRRKRSTIAAMCSAATWHLWRLPTAGQRPYPKRVAKGGPKLSRNNKRSRAQVHCIRQTTAVGLRPKSAASPSEASHTRPNRGTHPSPRHEATTSSTWSRGAKRPERSPGSPNKTPTTTQANT